MGEVTVRSAPDELSAGHDEYSRVPVHPQGEDRPVPQRLDEQERREWQRPPHRDLRPAQKPLDERREQPQSMHSDHHRIMTVPPLDRATCPEPNLVPPRIPELQQALDGDETNTHYQQHDVQRTLSSATSS